MNRAKVASETDGKQFLRDAFESEQSVLSVQLELSSKSITHDGVMGEVNEQHFIAFLRRHLPFRYQVDHGIVIDSEGSTSDQIDIVIFDRQYTPTLLDQQSHRFIPAEAVYCVFEVKPTINKGYLEYAAGKAASVRRLVRTSASIVHAGGEHTPKEPFSILAGIVAVNAEWVDGINSDSLSNCLASLTGEHALNCGIALRSGTFDDFSGSVSTTGPEGALAYFLFRLLSALQGLGTVPAVDWRRYASAFSGENA